MSALGRGRKRERKFDSSHCDEGLRIGSCRRGGSVGTVPKRSGRGEVAHGRAPDVVGACGGGRWGAGGGVGGDVAWDGMGDVGTGRRDGKRFAEGIYRESWADRISCSGRVRTSRGKWMHGCECASVCARVGVRVCVLLPRGEGRGAHARVEAAHTLLQR